MNWLQLLSAAFGAVAGYLLKFYLDRKKTAEERTFADKREHYRNLLLCLKSLREGKSEHTDMLWYEYSFLWFHAPDSVIKSANTLITKIKGESVKAEEVAPFVGELLLQIRRSVKFLAVQRNWGGLCRSHWRSLFALCPLAGLRFWICLQRT
jgi:hypothetical protein